MSVKAFERAVIAVSIGAVVGVLIWFVLAATARSYPTEPAVGVTPRTGQPWLDAVNDAVTRATTQTSRYADFATNLQKFIEQCNKLIASVSGIVAALIAFLFVARRCAGAPAPQPPPRDVSPTASDPPSRGRTPRNPQREFLLIAELRRRIAETTRLRRRIKRVRAARAKLLRRNVRYSMSRSALLVVLSLTVLHFATGSIQTYTRQSLGITDNAPLWLNYMQSLLLCILVPPVVIFSYRSFLQRSGHPGTLQSALLVGGVGALANGVVYFFSHSPEGLAQMMTAGRIPLAEGCPVPLIIFIFLQRIVALPLLALVACLLYQRVRLRSHRTRRARLAFVLAAERAA